MRDDLAKTEIVPFAGFWLRAGALVIDYMLVYMLISCIMVVTSLLGAFDIVDVAKMNVSQRGAIENTLESDNSLGNDIPENGSIVVTEQSEDLEAQKAKELVDNLNWFSGMIYLTCIALYFIMNTIMEQSKFQGSPGKIVFGIRVTDRYGYRIGFVRALIRNLLKIPSAALLFIGFFLAGWTSKKQGLHDMLSGCYLIESRI